MKMRWRVAAVIVCVAALSYCADNRPDLTLAEKPVIYLYPEQAQEVSVRLDYDGRLTDTIPAYGDGWKVTAWPDGRLVDHNDGKEYPYLFWEGEDRTAYDMTKGFVVLGSGTEAFLREKLEFLGLKEKEYEAFIEYWLPRMEGNPYNLITFQKEAYEETAGLLISPKPSLNISRLAKVTRKSRKSTPSASFILTLVLGQTISITVKIISSVYIRGTICVSTRVNVM